MPSCVFIVLKGYGWFGNFSTWNEAKARSIGYDSENILQTVSRALAKVKNGEAVYERDSVLFDKIEYSWELLSSLMWIAAQNKGHLNVIDFGGSLGSTYFQNKNFLDTLSNVCWNIVEQPSFVEEGKEKFENNILKFYYTIDECLSQAGNTVDCVAFSSVLQYLDDPYTILNDVLRRNIPYVIVDRTGFTLKDKERITIQKVPASIYKALYPCRFFNEEEFKKVFYDGGYELVVDFEALDFANIPSKYKGFVFRLKTHA